MADERSEAGKPEAWERVEEEECGDFEIFKVRRVRARSPRDGSEHDFHMAVAPHAVTVVAVTPDESLVLVEQFRHPLQRVTLETPAGMMEPGESPAEAAARELREETGYEGRPAQVIGRFELNPSWQVTRVNVAVVRDARPVAAKDEDAGEDVRVRLLPAAEVRRRVLAGEFESAVAITALALWDLNGRP
ncbi:MAG TPA: NUDIX hydrolase [Longimicrobiaceae bacterium]|nr:NUDIX hydrolase [Longimicrobiaceae bacterium]